MPVKTDLIALALEYAVVREQRQAITTAIRMLNETASQAATAGVKAGEHWLQIRNMLDEKDSHLFDREHELHFQLTRDR